MNLQRKINRPFTILLVDDRPENLISLEEMLATDNRVFIKAHSGNEALKLVLRNDDIGLIILDVQMPEMDGFEVAHLLKANPKTKDISIIFVTAIDKDEQHMLQGFGKGAADYLPKPLDIGLTRAKVDVFERLYGYQAGLKQALKDKEQVNVQLERFMHTVAHDLKSPLSGVVGLLYLLKEDEHLRDLPELLMYVDLAVEATTKLSDMISGILDYSRQHQFDQAEEDVDVHELLIQLVKYLFLPERVQISIQQPLPVLFTNRQKLQQVFQNLVSNAIKYNDKEQVKISIGGTEKEEFYEFYVKDNGPGIEAKDNERIFRLFEKVDQEGTGTGVGLNILKLLVESQGGKIWVQSLPGEGSCFYFEWRK